MAEEHLFNELLMANRWGRRARQLYHYGIAALLLGLAFLVTPPGGEGSLGRWALLAVAVTGVLVELAWIIDTSRPGKLAALITRPGKPTKPDARGGPDREPSAQQGGPTPLDERDTVRPLWANSGLRTNR